MEPDNRNYAVIIADVSGSKQLSGRSRYQTQLFLKSAIVQINEEFRDHIEAPFTITKGDEFQGLLTDLRSAFEMVLALEKLIFPVKLRFGLGTGNIYRMGGKLPIEMDGPGVSSCECCVEHGQKKKICYCLNTDDESLDLLTNTIFQLMNAIKKRWNERLYRLFWRYKDLGTYREVSAIEKHHAAGGLRALKTIAPLM
ncbi:MAG: SatD family protein [Calditrichia bacterium]